VPLSGPFPWRREYDHCQCSASCSTWTLVQERRTPSRILWTSILSHEAWYSCTEALFVFVFNPWHCCKECNAYQDEKSREMMPTVSCWISFCPMAQPAIPYIQAPARAPSTCCFNTRSTLKICQVNCIQNKKGAGRNKAGYVLQSYRILWSKATNDCFGWLVVTELHGPWHQISEKVTKR